MAGLLRLSLRGEQFFKIRNSYSTLAKIYKSNNDPKTLVQMKGDMNAFKRVYPHVVDSLLHGENPNLDVVLKHFKETLDYNLQGGDNTRGLGTVTTYRLLNDPESITKEQLHLVNVMGWCVELLNTQINVLDDIIDGSPTRRGIPAWFREKGVGCAIIDGMLLECAIYKVLKMYFKSQPYYEDILELFHDTTQKSYYGQSFDLLFSTNLETQKFAMSNLDNVATIAEHKAGRSSLYLPITAALYMSGITDSDTHEQLKEILLLSSRYFQALNDLEDCFGTPDETGKIGNDIQEGKCTWPLATAMKKCDQQQLQLLKDNYGCKDDACTQRVINLYRELDIPELLKDFEKELRSRAVDILNKSPLNLPEPFLKTLKHYIYLK